MTKDLDCVVCGSCTADILVKPFPLDKPVGPSQLHACGPIDVTTGGLASNAGIAMAKLGLDVAMLSYTGKDHWGRIMRERYAEAGIDTRCLLTHPELPSSSTIVLIDPSGERSFAHYQGAPKAINRATVMNHLDLIQRSKYFLIGYYSLLPNLQDDLPEIFAAIRAAGCKTAMDAAGTGGAMQPLDRILPHLDVYIPSHVEAAHQTGEQEPERILRAFRACGMPGLLGVKLGPRGAVLQTPDGEMHQVDPIDPPAPIVDTTGAGDSFYAGLIAGLVRGLDIPSAAQMAAAAGACCVTGRGASTAIRDFAETRAMTSLPAEDAL